MTRRTKWSLRFTGLVFIACGLLPTWIIMNKKSPVLSQYLCLWGISIVAGAFLVLVTFLSRRVTRI